jgi:pimeloyl-ACP methyl ester carboxylesterase
MTARPNIVLVHGAWADGSSWSGVVERLQADGYHVTAPQFPLTALADDVARLRQVLEFQDGPVIVAGHSYGGQVMTALGPDAPNVAGLVYVAAFGLDQGRRRPGPGEGDVRRAATPGRRRVRRSDGHPGLEDPAVLVPGRYRRPGTAARCRAHVRRPDGGQHRRDRLQPRRDGLAPRRCGPAHQDSSRDTSVASGEEHMAMSETSLNIGHPHLRPARRSPGRPPDDHRAGHGRRRLGIDHGKEPHRCVHHARAR